MFAQPNGHGLGPNRGTDPSQRQSDRAEAQSSVDGNFRSPLYLNLWRFAELLLLLIASDAEQYPAILRLRRTFQALGHPLHRLRH